MSKSKKIEVDLKAEAKKRDEEDAQQYQEQRE
jgi:hypothetical protein